MLSWALPMNPFKILRRTFPTCRISAGRTSFPASLCRHVDC